MISVVDLRSPSQNSLFPRGQPMDSFNHRPASQTSDRTGTSMNSPGPKMGPPSIASPDLGLRATSQGDSSPRQPDVHVANGGALPGPGSKLVQTAFIHKLYSMLEDKTIEPLISWSSTGDSFIMSPTNDFAKVLSQYFKHTNISSFVRQLNMYGFHKVNDVFHTGGPETAQWEFRHGANNFRKGDLKGLKEIKRRASKHHLTARSDTFIQPVMRAPISQPGTPGDTSHTDPEQRLIHLENALHDISARCARAEESCHLLSVRSQSLSDHVSKCHQWIRTLSNTLNTTLPPDSYSRSELAAIQKDVDQQHSLLRNGELGDFTGRPLSFNNFDNPVSPMARGFGFSDSRRSSIQMADPPYFGARPPLPPIPPQFASPRRYGSISTSNQTSPGNNRTQLPIPPQPHPLSNVQSSPNLNRRHTSADIREHGWPPNDISRAPSDPAFETNPNPVTWQASTAHELPMLPPGDPGLQDQFARYSISNSRRTTITAENQDMIPPAHREAAPQYPPPEVAPASFTMNSHVGRNSGALKFPRPGFEMSSAPSTRRSSMVHSLLNPTAEQDEDDGVAPDDRKRKRIM